MKPPISATFGHPMRKSTTMPASTAATRLCGRRHRVLAARPRTLASMVDAGAVVAGIGDLGHCFCPFSAGAFVCVVSTENLTGGIPSTSLSCNFQGTVASRVRYRQNAGSVRFFKTLFWKPALPTEPAYRTRVRLLFSEPARAGSEGHAQESSGSGPSFGSSPEPAPESLGVQINHGVRHSPGADIQRFPVIRTGALDHAPPGTLTFKYTVARDSPLTLRRCRED